MVDKLTLPATQNEVQLKVNDIIDNTNLGDLKNVTISNPSAGQNLTYDATNQIWKNTSTTATVAWGGITGTLSDQADLANALGDKVDALTTGPTAGTYTKVTINSDGLVTSGGSLSSGDIPDISATYYLASNPSGYTSNVGTVTSVNNTSPDSSGNVTINIPTVNNATLTVTQNGTSKGTFTANSSTDVTIALTDTTYSDFTGADGTSAGTAGLVKAPAATDNTKFLKGDGTWSDVPSELPSQTSQSGKFLTTNGTTVSWATVDALPSQTSQSGKFLTTNGTTASWGDIPVYTANEVETLWNSITPSA